MAFIGKDEQKVYVLPFNSSTQYIIEMNFGGDYGLENFKLNMLKTRGDVFMGSSYNGEISSCAKVSLGSDGMVHFEMFIGELDTDLSDYDEEDFNDDEEKG